MGVKLLIALALAVAVTGVPDAITAASGSNPAHRPGLKCWPDVMGGRVVFVPVENDSVIVVDGRQVVIRGVTDKPVVVGGTSTTACAPEASH